MKTKILYRFAIAIAFTGVMIACNKNNNNSNAGQSSTDLQTQSDDQTQVTNETDGIADDVNATLSGQSGVTGSSVQPGYSHGIAVQGGNHDTVTSYICDAVIIRDTVSNPHTLTISYNGSNCSGTRTRTGTVVVSWAAGTHWKDQGATVTVSIQNLKITRIRDGKSITINGTHLYTNVSGGSLANLSKGTPITHTITSDDMSITFDNGSKRTWHVARQRVYSYSDGVVITTSGLHTDGTNTGISEWGTNRFGNSFATQISQPLVVAQSCLFRITSGQVVVIRPEVTTTITFGLDSTGAATGCPGDGSYYFKLVWEGSGGKTYTFILPY
jgi:hypothetical protein